jgi:hypothetical protein
VAVVSLRDALSRSRLGARVALVEGHPGEARRQHPRRAKAGHATAEDGGVPQVPAIGRRGRVARIYSDAADRGKGDPMKIVWMWWMADHYRWIYRQLLENGYQIGPILQKNGLVPGAERPAAGPH